MGLDRMKALVAQAGLEDTLGGPGGPQFVHVAGTNGKGSVTAYLQHIMAAHGFRTGAYFSPYVYTPLERIQLGVRPIGEDLFASLATELRPKADAFDGTEMGGISEFEFKTAMGFLCWKQARCEWVALEVGLGGALDASNVVSSAAQVLVSVGLDHVSVLGSTYAEIAREKVGVFRPGKVAVIGELPPEAMAVAEAHAQQVGAVLWRLGREVILDRLGDRYRVSFPGGSVEGLRPGLVGAMQPANMALAVAAWAAAGGAFEPEAVRDGVWETTIPGRFERRNIKGQTWVLDGAHNHEAAQCLRETLDQEYPGTKWTLITGMVVGHEPVRFYGPLADVMEEVIFAPIDFRRAVPPDDLAVMASGVFARTRLATSVAEAVSWAQHKGRPVLVTGSFYLLGEVGASLR